MTRHGAGGRSFDDVDHIPQAFPEYMMGGVHTGRGTGHQIAMTDSIVPALTEDRWIQDLIAADRICYFAGAKHGRGMRNRDLVFGAPGAGAVFDDTVGMSRGIPNFPVAAGEYKSIMTELGKNAGNRRDDLMRHARATRQDHGARTIAFGVCPINASDSYYSYTAGAWRHVRDGKLAAAKAVETLRACIVGGPEDTLDVLWTPVIVADNDPELPHAYWLRSYPQPADGNELSWGHFIDRLAYLLADRLR